MSDRARNILSKMWIKNKEKEESKRHTKPFETHLKAASGTSI